jgi:hypothetical protein
MIRKQIIRHTPLMGPNAYKTYSMRALFRPATCAEIDCPNYLNGWTFKLEHLRADPKLEYAVRNSRKKFVERELDGDTYLVFEPGQTCFAVKTHRVQREDMVERPLLFVGRGDWRTYTKQGLPPDAIRHKRAEDWVDDFANHQDKLKTLIERG